MRITEISNKPVRLFSRKEWFDEITQRKQEIEIEIKGYNGEKLLNTSDDALVKYFYKKYNIDVPVLNTDQSAWVAEQHEAQIDVSNDHRFFASGNPFRTGTQVNVEIPFSGDPLWFQVQPTTYSLTTPYAVIGNTSIVSVR